jgi:hypothetical protein
MVQLQNGLFTAELLADVPILSALRAVFRAIISANRLFERSSVSWRLVSSGAEQRALKLLVTELSPTQRAQYLSAGHFEVVGGHTGRRYRILRSAQMDVERLDDTGRRVELLCFAPEPPAPIGEVLSSLELFEIDALNLANRFPAGLAR